MKKKMANNQSTHKKNGEGEEKSTKRHVYIEPGVQIDVVQNLKEQHKTERGEDTAAHNNQLFWTRVAAALIFIYTLVTIWQLIIARDTFNAANRPYIGVSAANMTHFIQNEAGEFVPTQNGVPTKNTVSMSYRIELKNFGPVPGTNYFDSIRVFLNGREQSLTSPIRQGKSTIYPTQIIFFTGNMGGEIYRDIMGGKLVLKMEITVEYDGPSGHTKECSSRQYEPSVNAFTGISECPK